jgi:hypothetical protein
VRSVHFNSDCRGPATHGTLTKRAAELREILGLAKCFASLSQANAQQSGNSAVSHPSENEHPRHGLERTASSLRPEASEWTPTGKEGKSNTLKKMLHLGLNGDTAARDLEPKTLLPPFTEYSSTMTPVFHAGTFYLPPTVANHDSPSDLNGDGKQFISSLSAKRDLTTPQNPQNPIAPPTKRLSPPPGLTFAPTQQSHSFPLTASLLPQTFSVHLLSTLHIRFQHVSATLEKLDSFFASELSKAASTQPPVSTRWESWMSPSGTAGMSQALVELRKSLDELCGATARAGWIVDTWGAYQDGALDGSKQSEQGLGSAAINGVEIGREGQMKNGIHAPIGRPCSERGMRISTPVDGTATPERPKMGNPTATAPVTLPTVGTVFRTPPGLAFPLTPPGNSIPSACRGTPTTNGSKYFPGINGTPVSGSIINETNKSMGVPDKDRILSGKSSRGNKGIS